MTKTRGAAALTCLRDPECAALVKHLHEGGVLQPGRAKPHLNDAAEGLIGAGLALTDDDGWLHLDGQQVQVISLDVGGTKILGALVDLQGRIYHRLEVKWAEFTRSGAHDLSPIYHVIDHLHERAQYEILGIGIGAPGITDVGRGIVEWAPGPQWRDLPLKAIVSEHTGYPVYIENDVNLITLGEYAYGAGRGARTIIGMMIGTGIGAGIIIDGRLHRGAHNAAGEVGYMVPGLAFIGGDYRDFGAMESVASGTGIAMQARARFPDMAAQDTQAIFRAAEAGDPQAAAIVDEAVNYLTIMVANAVAMIDPDRIVIGGGVAQTSLGLSARIEEKLTYLLPAKPSLWHWELGAYASVKGAATLVLDGLLNDTLMQERESSQD